MNFRHYCDCLSSAGCHRVGSTLYVGIARKKMAALLTKIIWQVRAQYLDIETELLTESLILFTGKRERYFCKCTNVNYYTPNCQILMLMYINISIYCMKPYKIKGLKCAIETKLVVMK